MVKKFDIQESILQSEQFLKIETQTTEQKIRNKKMVKKIEKMFVKDSNWSIEQKYFLTSARQTKLYFVLWLNILCIIAMTSGLIIISGWFLLDGDLISPKSGIKYIGICPLHKNGVFKPHHLYLTTLYFKILL